MTDTEKLPEFRIVIEHDGMRKHEYSILKGFGVPGRDDATPEGRDEMDRCMGAAIQQSIKDWIPLAPFDKQIRSAFDGIDQIDGPPMAYYEKATNGGSTRYTYQTFAWTSDDPAKIVARFQMLAAGVLASGRSIVWRSRPTLLRKNEEDGKFYASCRLHVLPFMELGGSKIEGEFAPEA